MIATDLVAGNAAMLLGVGAAGAFVGAFGVPWTITVLGLGVAVVAIVLYGADARSAGLEGGEGVDDGAGDLHGVLLGREVAERGEVVEATVGERGGRRSPEG